MPSGGIATYLQRYEDFEAVLETREDVAAAWEGYRQVMALYIKHRPRVDKSTPFDAAEVREAGVRFKLMLSAPSKTDHGPEPEQGDGGAEGTSPGQDGAAAGGASSEGRARVSNVRRPRLSVRPPAKAVAQAQDEE